MGCFRLSQRRSKSREPPNKLLKMVAGLASSSREKEMATKSSSSMPRESSDSAPTDGISPPRMSDFHSAPSSVWPESSPSRSPARAFSRGTPMPLPPPLKRRQLKSQRQQPLPLPKPTPAASSTSPKLSRIPSRPHPLPLPADDHAPEPLTNTFLRSFDFEDVSRLCRNFSPQCQIRAGSLGPVYRCSMMTDDTGSSSSRELDVVRVTNKHHQEEWMAKLKLIAQLEHDTLCKLIGFSVQPDGERLLVFESSGSGDSVDKVLAAASAKNQLLDWDARMKIALGAALGLAYLHSKEVAYPSSFGSSNVLVDKDCNVKLVDYCEDTEEAPSCQQKANVRSYGILLLELLTGKQQVERLLPQGRDLVQWARPFVNDTAKLSSILDPRLGQRPTTRAVKDLANFALNCLYSDPRLRPTMREAVSLLKALTFTAAATTASGKGLFGRSATFSMRGMMSPMSSNQQQQQYQARSAGASPARYASPLSSASASASPFFSCSSSLAHYCEDITSRQRRRAQFSR